MARGIVTGRRLLIRKEPQRLRLSKASIRAAPIDVAVDTQPIYQGNRKIRPESSGRRAISITVEQINNTWTISCAVNKGEFSNILEKFHDDRSLEVHVLEMEGGSKLRGYVFENVGSVKWQYKTGDTKVEVLTIEATTRRPLNKKEIRDGEPD
ncbi:MAG: hypothetical protein MJA29_00140 [Candidatus Omnitrophica bacterium]|nr:hypothetical protein [Candidatus Omnitrophota bacterium]